MDHQRMRGGMSKWYFRFEDIAGTKSGLLTAVKPIEVAEWGWRWLCRCECGRTVELYRHHIEQGVFRSCGDDCEVWRTQQRRAGFRGVPRNTRKAPKSSIRAVKVWGRCKERKNVKNTDCVRKLRGWIRAEKKDRAKYGSACNNAGGMAQFDANGNRVLKTQSPLVGLEFDLLFVWSLHSLGVGTPPIYRCLCACGDHCTVNANELISGRRGDCGHRVKEAKRLWKLRKKKRLADMSRKRAPWGRFIGMKR